MVQMQLVQMQVAHAAKAWHENSVQPGYSHRAQPSSCHDQQYLEKDRLMLSPAQSAMIGSVASVPWCIKPLYGEVLLGVLKYCLC